MVVNNYPRLTWTMFIISNEETFSVFETFAKQVQVKLNEKITRIKSEHGIKFENAKFNEFYNNLWIDHTFFQLLEHLNRMLLWRENRTMVDITRTLLIETGIDIKV